MNLIVTDSLPSSARLGGREIICDGVNANLCNRGKASELRMLGIEEPLSAPTATVSDSGAVTKGKHIIAVTFAIIESGVIAVESNPILTEAVDVEDDGVKKISLGSVPVSGNPAVNARVVYMTAADGNKLYRVTEGASIADNTSTEFDISIADASLTATEVSYANAPLPACPFVVASQLQIALAGAVTYSKGTSAIGGGGGNPGIWRTFFDAGLTRGCIGKRIVFGSSAETFTIKDFTENTQVALLDRACFDVSETYRIIGQDGGTVFFSNPLPGNIEGYDPTSALSSCSVGYDDGDVITALGICRDHFVACKKRSTHLLTNNGAQWTPLTVSTQIGCASHHTMVQDGRGNAIWYGGAGGVYLMQGGESLIATNRPENISRQLEEFLRTQVNHARDHMAHACWYAPRKWYMLWLTAVDQSDVTDLLLVADFSESLEGVPCKWWVMRLPAMNSRVELFSDNEARLLVSNYHGQILVFDVGNVDGMADAASVLGVITEVASDGSYLVCMAEYFSDPDGGTKPDGAVVTILSGAAKGQRRLLSSVTDGTKLNMDTTLYGGKFDPLPAVGDLVMVGGYESYWKTPRMVMAEPTQKRWQEAVIGTRDLGGQPECEQSVTSRGRMSVCGRTPLPVALRDESVVRLGCFGEDMQLKVGTSRPAQPWQLDTVTVRCVNGGETR
jgi:hypothetical protein